MGPSPEESKKKKMARPVVVVRMAAAALLLATLAAAQNCQILKDFGCRNDLLTPVMAKRVTVVGPMTRELCAGACNGLSYTVAGVENGNLCYCDYSAQGSVADPSDCKALCPGDPTETCGGTLRLNEVRWGHGRVFFFFFLFFGH